MKSLILTTQDARELDKLGGLTITKPIKPTPRYIEGASFHRDADCADIWHLVDNGPEFADCAGMEKACRRKGARTTVYYCHPYSSWERGSNERQNGMIRRKHPKGTDFATISASTLKKTEEWINNYPRKIFNFHTAAEVFEACMNSI